VDSIRLGQQREAMDDVEQLFAVPECFFDGHNDINVYDEKFVLPIYDGGPFKDYSPEVSEPFDKCVFVGRAATVYQPSKLFDRRGYAVL